MMSGGCQCGAIRYHVSTLADASVCHCRMCQKAFGNFFAPLVKAKGVEWLRGARALFRSSNMSKRGFCRDCGTPLTLEDNDGTIELAIATLDDPRAVTPAYHANMHDCIMQPAQLAALPPETPERRAENLTWNAKIVSHQHPDTDTDTWPEENSK